MDCAGGLKQKADHRDRKPDRSKQYKYPKILQRELSPAIRSKNPIPAWNSPGHGDVYTALLTSGMLKKLLDLGIFYAFISNSDNLGTRLDERFSHRVPWLGKALCNGIHSNGISGT